MTVSVRLPMSLLMHDMHYEPDVSAWRASLSCQSLACADLSVLWLASALYLTNPAHIWHQRPRPSLDTAARCQLRRCLHVGANRRRRGTKHEPLAAA